VAAGRDWEELRGAIRDALSSGSPVTAKTSITITAKGTVLAAVMYRAAADDAGTTMIGLRRDPSVSSGGKRIIKPWSNEASPVYPLPVREWEEIYRRKVDEDTSFWSGAPILDGDWPATWKNGFVYDLETTRMCTFPAMGVFR